MTRTIQMLITVDIGDEVTIWDDALFHYEQQGRGRMEDNAFMPKGQELDLPHAILEATLAWMADTDLKLVQTEVSDVSPDGRDASEEITVVQASAYALEQGQHLSRSYLARAVKRGRIEGRKVVPPTGGEGYYVIPKTALLAYLGSERKPGRKKANAGQKGDHV